MRWHFGTSALRHYQSGSNALFALFPERFTPEFMTCVYALQHEAMYWPPQRSSLHVPITQPPPPKSAAEFGRFCRFVLPICWVSEFRRFVLPICEGSVILGHLIWRRHSKMCIIYFFQRDQTLALSAPHFDLYLTKCCGESIHFCNPQLGVHPDGGIRRGKKTAWTLLWPIQPAVYCPPQNGANRNNQYRKKRYYPVSQTNRLGRRFRH